MPIYEYECRKCKAHSEVIQKISDKPLVKCSKCGGQLEKQWSNTSFQLKGAGWYVTDYAAKKPETTKQSEQSETSAGENKESKNSDAAQEPAAKQSKETKESKADAKEKPAAKKTGNAKSTASSGGAASD